jgi:transposase
MRTLSLDLRERILTSYDHQEGTREEIAHRYRVSLGMVKKLLQQRRRTGQIGPRHHYSGRKPMIVEVHRCQLRALLSRKPDMTLKELRHAVALPCSLPAIHYVLEKMGLTYKKRHSEPASKTVRTSRGHAASGGVGRPGSTRRN